MGAIHNSISPEQIDFIRDQKMFFVASAPLAKSGRINLSPKGIDTFRVLSSVQVAYLDLTGSGNETAAHVLENSRLTIMFCAFADKPLILRLYGQGEVIRTADSRWNQLLSHFTPQLGQRQIILLNVQGVQGSCGFGVPLYEYAGDRTTLTEWAEKKGDVAIREYHLKRNAHSIDGLPTGFA